LIFKVLNIRRLVIEEEHNSQALSTTQDQGRGAPPITTSLQCTFPSTGDNGSPLTGGKGFPFLPPWAGGLALFRLPQGVDAGGDS
jgi:hypothetical protein